MARRMGDASAVNEVQVHQNTIHIPAEFLTQILSHLPQEHLLLCREVCPYWRDVIDLYCPMKDIICLRENDALLAQKLKLRMTCCILFFCHTHTPNMSLSHPQTIRNFLFSDRPWDFNGRVIKDKINMENARGLLSQIEPSVEHLSLDTRYVQNHILAERYQFPNLRTLRIGLINVTYTVNHNLRILFAYRFSLLERFNLRIHYFNEILTDEAYANFFNFLANHRHTLKRLHADICYGVNHYELNAPNPEDLPDITRRKFYLSNQVERLLSKGQLQLEYLDLSLPPKYVPAWAPIIASQKKLISLTVGCAWENVGPKGVPFYAVAPGILSSISTLRTVVLIDTLSVAYDGVTWVPLDVSLFRDAVNLTDLVLNRPRAGRAPDAGTPSPNENDGAEITNLRDINTTSLKSLTIARFFCNSEDLQSLVENGHILETLHLGEVQAPPTSAQFAATGVHGGIIKSFLDKESKREIIIAPPINYEHDAHNQTLEAQRHLYPDINNENMDTTFFIRTTFS